MENKISEFLESAKEAIRYWWIYSLMGVAMIAAGMMVFCQPVAAYASLCLMFGILILVSGIMQVIFFFTSKNFTTGRGWILASGVIEVLLGILLTLNPALSAITLPIFMGFWLLFRSFTTIGVGGDMCSLNISGGTWVIVSGVLLMLMAMWTLFQPLFFGTSMVLIWVAVTLIVAGLSMFILSFQLRKAHKQFQ